MIAESLLALALAAPADPVTPDLSREQAAAQSSRAQDVRGALPSLYRGLYFHPEQEPFRRCVGQREGSFIYNVTGGGGDQYQTTYQFHEANWRRGLTFMMASESRRTNDGLRAEARALIEKPMRTWGRYWIDRAFYTALNFNGLWSGRHHWNGGSHAC